MFNPLKETISNAISSFVTIPKIVALMESMDVYVGRIANMGPDAAVFAVETDDEAQDICKFFHHSLFNTDYCTYPDTDSVVVNVSKRK